jgi:hypothetical protein
MGKAYKDFCPRNSCNAIYCKKTLCEVMTVI